MKIDIDKKVYFNLLLTFFLLSILISCSDTVNELSDQNENLRQEGNTYYHTDDEKNLLNRGNFNLIENPSIDEEMPVGESENLLKENNTTISNVIDQEIDIDQNNDAINEGDAVNLPSTVPTQNESTPTSIPHENIFEERPTLRSPVESENDPRILTIGLLNLDSVLQSSFRERYTRRFEWEYPNIDIEFSAVISEYFDSYDPPISDSVAELKKLMTGDNPPDVLFLGYNDYRALMEEGLLVALNPFFVDSELSLDDFEPIVADGLVNPQDGQTYGLSPYFTANALIYNKDLFDEMNMPYPRDRMTWDEIFTLAKQMTFSTEDKNVYGFMFDLFNYRPPNIFEIWNKYIPGLGVQVYDQEAKQMAVNNNKWAHAFASIKDMYDHGVFPLDQSEVDRYVGRNKFYSNTIAMGLVDYSTLRFIIDQTLQGQVDIPNWDIVSVPVHSEAPHVGAGVVMEPVIVINVNGRNQLDAWRLIELIHSSEWASAGEETFWYRLSSRKDHAVNMTELDYNKEALYQLRPAEQYEPYSNEFGLQSINVKYLDSLVFHKMLTGELGIKEALEEWENSMNNMIFHSQFQ